MMQKRSLFRFDAWWLYTSRARLIKQPDCDPALHGATGSGSLRF